MSLNTWRQDHYPVEANDPSLKNRPLEDTRHSLIKWYGLRKAVLYKHGLQVHGGTLFDPSSEETFHVNSDSCALCASYYHTADDAQGIYRCAECPLAQQRLEKGRPVPCDNRLKDESMSPYGVWEDNHDPEPMIKELEATYKALGGGDPGELEG